MIELDRAKVKVAVRRLNRDRLLELLDRAIDAVPAMVLPSVIEGFLKQAELEVEPPTAGAVLRAVTKFHEKSLAGEYYEGFDVNSKNCTLQSPGTEAWIAECERLFEAITAAVQASAAGEVRSAYEILFDLLRRVDRGEEIVFFADEGGSYEVGVDWRRVYPAYFRCLSSTAAPEEYAKAVLAAVDDFNRHDRENNLKLARAAGTKEQRAAMKGV